MGRRLFGCAATLALAMSAVACGGGPMSATDGKQAADKARRPVVETYWTVRRSLDGTTHQDDGQGAFVACTGPHKNSVYYKIYSPTFATSEKETAAQLTAATRARLKGSGWDLQPSEDHQFMAAKGGVDVRLREISVTGAGTQMDALYVESACVDVGQAQALLTRVADKYPGKNAASAPVPTDFPTATP